MTDPFSAIDAECGDVSHSQDSRLPRSPFLNDEGYSPASSSSDDDDDGASLPPADAPILFYSPPTSPIAGGNTSDPTVVADDAYPADVAKNVDDADDTGAAINVGNTDAAAATTTTTDVADAVTAVDVATTTTDAAVPVLGLPPQEILADHPPKRFKKVSRGPKLRSPDPEEENDDDKYRYQSVEILKDLLETRSCTRAADGRRRLPSSFVDKVLEDDRVKHRRGVKFPRDLPELARNFFNKCDKRFANTDILDIAKMKGMEFPSVKWWRAGGYEAKKDKEPGGSPDA